MLTECRQDSFEFASLGGRKVTAAFEGGAITSDAGTLLLRDADHPIGFSRQVAACFKDGRRQDRIEQRVETLVAQRIHGIALRWPLRRPDLGSEFARQPAQTIIRLAGLWTGDRPWPWLAQSLRRPSPARSGSHNPNP